MATRRIQSLPLFADEEGVQKFRPWAEVAPGVRINGEGFRSGEFRPDPSRTTVLVLGDSLAYGLSAQPLSESSVDRVERAGYRVFNAGVPGTGPGSMRRLPRKWVHRLRPDVTAVTSFMGNDMARDPMLPGGVMAFDGDRWLGSPEEALRHWTDKSNAFAQPPRTDAGSVPWGRPCPGATRPAAFSDHRPTPEAIASVRDRIERIRSVATSHGSRFLLFVIPAKQGPLSGLQAVHEQREVFEAFDPLVRTS